MRDYRREAVKDVSSECLLKELLERHGTQEGPRRSTYHGDWRISTVGIGNDHTATILLPDEDKGVLDDIVAGMISADT